MQALNHVFGALFMFFAMLLATFKCAG
jgi:hypothetical protein